MLRRIEDFQNQWNYESEMTLKLFSNLTDETLGQKITENGRSLGFLAWHVVLTHGEILELVGLEIDCPPIDAEVPASAREIVENLERTANSVATEVGKNWTDETLTIEDEMFGEMWTRGTTLYNMIAHQTHHRGQITVLMRQANLPVVGVYGPAKEEWEAMGMTALV